MTDTRAVFINPNLDDDLLRLSAAFEHDRLTALVKVSIPLLDELADDSHPVTFRATKADDGTYELVITRVDTNNERGRPLQKSLDERTPS